MYRVFAAVSAGVVALSCSGPVNQENSGWLQASMHGVVAGDYEGTGDFHVIHHPEQDAVMFQLVSEGKALATGQWLNIVGFGDTPTAGRHQVVEAAKVYGEHSGFTATYERRSDGWVESYGSVSGELVVTSSSTDRLEGRFQLTAARYCRSPLVSGPGGPLPEGSCTPTRLDRSAPSIDVTGSFMAVRVEAGTGTRM